MVGSIGRNVERRTPPSPTRTRLQHTVRRGQSRNELDEQCRSAAPHEACIRDIEKIMLLTNKLAVISGAASRRGIGRATAKLFAGQAPASRSWTSMLQVRRPPPTGLAPAAVGIGCDVADPTSCRQSAEQPIAALWQGGQQDEGVRLVRAAHRRPIRWARGDAHW